MQCLLGGLLQQQLADVGIGLGGLLEDVADALVGRGQRGGSAQHGEGAHGREQRGHWPEALRARGQHGIDFLRAGALLAQAAGEAVEDEVLQLDSTMAFEGAIEAKRCPRTARRPSASSASRSSARFFLDQHADLPMPMAAQRERVAVAGGQVADAEHADQGLELVGQRDHRADAVARQFVAREARLVVVLDGIGHGARRGRRAARSSGP